MVDHDEAMDRLRADDPATGSHPDLHRLRSLIAHKAPASQGVDAATRVDDDLMRGPRLRAPWIAAAAVAAVGLSGGGYALGLQQAPEAPPAATGGPALTLDPASPGLQPMQDAMAGEAGTMTMGSAQGSFTSSSSMSWDMGPVRLTAGEDLPDGPGTGEVRALDSDQDPAAVLASLADHLGVEGRPLPESVQEMAGMGDETLVDPDKGYILNANDSGGPLSFGFHSLYQDPYCAETYTEMPDEEMRIVQEEWQKSYGEELVFPTPELCRVATGERPDEATAIQAAADFFTGVGIDLDDYEVHTYGMSTASGQESYTSVEAMHKDHHGGQLYLSATVSPDGLVSASGSVGDFTSLGQYPIISAAEAVERYATREFSTDYSVQADEEMVWTEDGAVATAMPEEEWVEPTPVPAPEAGERIPLLRKDKVVTGAELVQGSMWLPSGGSIEVPVWKLSTGDGNTYPVLALADEAIDYRPWD